MNFKSGVLAGAFAFVLQLYSFGPASAVPVSPVVDASANNVGIVITETAIPGGGSYTVTNNSVGGLTAFGVSNPQSQAFIEFFGNTLGGVFGDGFSYFYESRTLNAANWLTDSPFLGSFGGLTFQETFGDFTSNVEPGENTINWYEEVDGSLQPGQTSSDFFIFGDNAILASIGLGIIGNGLIVFNNLSINTAVSAVPIPAALPLFGTGLALMGFIGWRRRQKAAA